ncbi:MAG: hypothetical protein RSF02_02200 [Bacilli bacterium]
MKNKKGFISITVVYSFFLVFLMMLLSITASYVNNRMLLKTMKDDVKTSLGYNMSGYLIDNYQSLKMNYHTNMLANGANDGSYRFSGANPNNYVCFGPGSTKKGITCPDNNLYRIIGVFDKQVKLIKKTSVGKKAWDGSNANTWVGSTIYTYLNGEYLTSLTSTWSNKITTTSWQVGGMTQANGRDAVPATVYNYEVGKNKANVTSTSKIGLIYVSDYGFAASPNNWTNLLQNYGDSNITSSNWLYGGSIHVNEWTISRNSGNNISVFWINNGLLWGSYFARDNLAIRPSFYLESSVELNGGTGKATDPYRIK